MVRNRLQILRLLSSLSCEIDGQLMNVKYRYGTDSRSLNFACIEMNRFSYDVHVV